MAAGVGWVSAAGGFGVVVLLVGEVGGLGSLAVVVGRPGVATSRRALRDCSGEEVASEVPAVPCCEAAASIHQHGVVVELQHFC